MNSDNKYPDLKKFSKSINIKSENLVQAFELEQVFHKKVLSEKRIESRKKLYADIYKKVHQLYGQPEENIFKKINPKKTIVRLFKKELEGKSILDVGCGAGYFLAAVHNSIKHDHIIGLDVSIPNLSKGHNAIEFIETNIIDFQLNKKFDVVFSDNVLEHIAPNDFVKHIASIKSHLKNGGVFIVVMPHKFYGPHDITRIKDFTYTNKIPAQGTHLNETTYGELIELLESEGFSDFKTTLNIPIVSIFFCKIGKS